MATFDIKVVLLGGQSSGAVENSATPCPGCSTALCLASHTHVLFDNDAGKSCLLQQYVAKEWRSALRPTYGPNFAARAYLLPAGRPISLGLWDTSGSPEFQGVSKRFIAGAHVAIAVCDLTSRSSWEKLKIWVGGVGRCGPERDRLGCCVERPAIWVVLLSLASTRTVTQSPLCLSFVPDSHCQAGAA